MSTNSSDRTLADYVIIAVSPLLIMALVGSLVFFLLEVLYAGQYQGRLQWILFFFVFGAVLIARISMTGEIAGRAGIYGLVLGLLVWLGLQTFVDYPSGSPLAKASGLVNLGLIGLIWWCAHRLTWDCTFLDESADPTGQGLLQAAGLEQTPAAPEEKPAENEAAQGQKQPGWWARYQRYCEERRRKHTPGVWVIYFSLAALPLFGLGQSLIPPQEVGRRRYAFWLLGIYVASGLGLLLTTAFLGLRRYLRQRGLRMPPAITGVWLSLGAVLIVGLLTAGALLPRPHPEYALVSTRLLGSPERDASRGAVKRDGSGKGEGRSSSDTQEADAQDGAGKQNGQAGGKEPGGKTDGKGQGSGPGRDGSGQKGESGSGGKQGKGGDSQGQGQDGSGSKSGTRQDGGQGKDPQPGRDSSAARPPADHSGGSPSPPASPASGLLASLSGLLEVLKWIVFAILAVVVAAVVLLAVLRFLANFTGWAKGLLDSLRALWESLFGGRREAAAAAEEESDPGPAPPPPFSSFDNPFLDGRADRLPPDELVRYSFAALQSWAWERDLGRGPGETPLEFAGRVGAEVPGLEAEARQLAGLYARAVYAHGPLPAGCREALAQFWRRLEAVAEQPLSA